MKRLRIQPLSSHHRSSPSNSASPWWNGLPAHSRSTRWAAVFCSLAIVALLLGFHHVVKSAVAQGALFRMSTATRAQAEWRCHALKGHRVRESCMRQLDEPPVQVADAAPLNEVTTRVAQR